MFVQVPKQSWHLWKLGLCFFVNTSSSSIRALLMLNRRVSSMACVTLFPIRCFKNTDCNTGSYNSLWITLSVFLQKDIKMISLIDQCCCSCLRCRFKLHSLINKKEHYLMALNWKILFHNVRSQCILIFFKFVYLWTFVYLPHLPLCKLLFLILNSTHIYSYVFISCRNKGKQFKYVNFET